MSETPMKKLKNSFLNFEKSTILSHKPAILHRREEKNNYFDWKDKVKKAIHTDFIKLYRLNNNSFGYKSLAFNIDYINIENPIFTVSIKHQDETITSSKPMDYETFKATLNSFNKECNLLVDSNKRKTRIKIDSEIYSLIVSKFDISKRDFEIDLIKDQVKTFANLIEKKAIFKHEIKKTEEIISNKKIRSRQEIASTSLAKEYQALLIQHKELEKKMAEMKSSLSAKEKKMIADATQSDTHNLLNLKQYSIFNDTALRSAVENLQSQHPKNAAIAISKMVEDIELKAEAKIKKQEEAKKRKKLSNN